MAAQQEYLLPLILGSSETAFPTPDSLSKKKLRLLLLIIEVYTIYNQAMASGIKVLVDPIKQSNPNTNGNEDAIE